MTETRIPTPTAETVLHVTPRAWATTQAIFERWLGATPENALSRTFRDRLRAECFLQLDRHYIAGRVAKRQPTPTRCEWMRLGLGREDRETTTVEAAARFERDRAS